MTFRSTRDRKDVRFEDDTFDVRNQEVRSRVDEKKIGTVDDVLVDDNGRTRYLSVMVDGDNRHVLLPVGEAEADRNGRVVWVDGLTRENFRTLPDYDRNPASINDEYETRLHGAYDSAYSGERYYDRSDYRSSGWERGSSTGRSSGRLERVDKISGVDVASGDPDPRGWAVVGADGRELGRVDHLIGDTGLMKVRYLVMKIDRGMFNEDRNVLIPVGHVDLDTRNNRVVSNAADANVIRSLPAYTGGDISREDEQRITSAFSGSYTGARRYEQPRYRDENLYGRSANTGTSQRGRDEQRITRSEEELKVGTRERKAGEVDVHKRVETEHVRKPVTTHREEVEVERRPATGQHAKPRIGDQEIVMPVTEEEVVVEKRPQVKEEIVVRKRDVTDRKIVEDDVRKERVEVEERRNDR